jgi:dynein heavy chain
VRPKEAKLNESKQALAEAEKNLNEKKEQLQEVMDLLNKLERDYQSAKKEKEDLEAKINKVRVQLDVAEKLTTGLKGEKESWRKKAVEFRQEEKGIIGDILLCSGIIAYLGAFPMSYREETIDKWK